MSIAMRKQSERKAMNVRVLCIVIPFSVLLLAGCSGGDPASLMARAKKAHAQGDYQAAVVNLKNVLKDEPNNAHARVMLSRAALAQGDTETTVNQANKALDLGAAPGEVQPQLARALLGMARYRQVLETIDPKVAEDEAARAALEAARGEAHLALGDIEPARMAFKHALEADKQSLSARLGQARLELAQGRADKAAQALASATAIAPEHAQVALLSGDLAVANGRFDEAIADYRQAIDGASTEILPRARFQARTKLARIYLRNDEPDEADSVVGEMLKQSRGHPTANYLAGLIAYRRGDYATAATRLQTVLSASPDNPYAKMLLGAIKMKQGQYAQAQTHLGEVVARQPNNVRARLLYARALFHSGASDRATAVLTEGMAIAGDKSGALSLLGAAASRDGQVKDILTALDDQPGDQAQLLQISLGRALLDAGRTDDAMKVLSEGGGEGGDMLQRRRLEIIAALRSGNKQRALEQSKSLVKEYPDSAESHVLAGGVQMTLGNPKQAKEQFQRAAALSPDSALGDYQLGLLALSRGEPDEALDSLDNALSKEPKNVDVMATIARAWVEQGSPKKAVKQLEKVRSIAPKALQPRLMLARLYLAAGESGKARTIGQELVDLAPDRGQMYAVRGLAELADDASEEAVKTLTKASRLSPEVGAISMALARAQLAAGRNQAALNTLQALHDEHPEANRVSYMLATTQARADDAKAAMATAKALDDRTAKSGLGALLKGELLARAGDYEAAVTALTRAAQAGQRKALPLLLQSAQRAKLDKPAAGLEAWLVAHPKDSEVRFKLGNWYVNRGEYQAALPHLKRLADAGNVAALNNLAWVYQQLGDSRALETALRARELAPESPAVLDTLGWIQTLNGNLKAGVTALSKAVDGAPAVGAIRYHYAEALARSGKRQAARKQIERTLEGDQPFAERQAAEHLRQRLDNSSNY